MNKFGRLILIAMGIMVISCVASAQSEEIYTWTDENGVEHFVDTPSDNANAVSRKISGASGASREDTTYTQGDSEDASEAVEPAEKGEETLSYAQQKREDMALERAERHKAQAEKDRICSQASSLLATIEPSRRVMYTNEKGETVRLDDDERMQRIAEQKKLIAENCR